MITYARVEVQIEAFLASALNGGEFQPLYLRRETPPVPIRQEAVWALESVRTPWRQASSRSQCRDRPSQ
jgi:hypothetical protein